MANVQGVIAGSLAGWIGRKVMRKAKFSWIGYGLLAYVGLRLMRRYGIFGPQADRVIRTMENGVRSVARNWAPR